MVCTCVVFGPNDGYFVNSPQRWAQNNLPPALVGLMSRQPKIRDIQEMALGPDGSYLVAYIEHDGSWHLQYNNIPQGLLNWLVKDGYSVRDLPTIQCSLGPNGAYFAWDKGGSVRGGLTQAMEDACKKRTNGTGNWLAGAFPESVSFGPNGAYVVITTSGGGYWDLKGCASELNNTLIQLKSLNGIFVCLSPFNSDLWILLDCNGKPRLDGRVPDEAVDNFNNFEVDIQALIQSQRAQTTRTRSTAPARRSVSASNINNGLKLGLSGLKLLNAVMGSNNSGGGGSVNIDTTSFDFSSTSNAGGGSNFWTPINNAANDPIQ